jgi:cell wall-associated NlpC family hydrolase
LHIDADDAIIFVTICNMSVIPMLFVSAERKKSLLALLLACVLAFQLGGALLGAPAEAVSKAELKALKQQQEELAKKKADIQKQADAAARKVNAQTEQLAILNAKLEVTNSELENLSEQITFYTYSIAEMENEIYIQEQRYLELLQKYRKSIREMEENGGTTYLGVLLGASSFEDLLGRIDCIREIMAYNTRLINDVQDAKERTMRAKADMEAEMAAQEKVFKAYQEKQADLAAQQEEAKAILASLKADSAEYQEQLETVKSLQASLSSRISDMEEKLAELERIRAEQEAAARLAAQKNNKWYGESAGTASGQEIAEYAKNFLGVPYVYGGTSPKGFDCSGLVYYCYRHFGYSINRTASSQALNGVAVSSSDLQPGDIVIFTARGSSHIGHCGIYIGNGQFIHAPHTGDVVKISSLATGSYKDRYWGARRIVSG